jgi:hypothetical protein
MNAEKGKKGRSPVQQRVGVLFVSADQDAPVCAENLDSLLVMQPADQGMRPDTSDPLNRAQDRRIFGQGRGAFSRRCNSPRKILGLDADVARPTR